MAVFLRLSIASHLIRNSLSVVLLMLLALGANALDLPFLSKGISFEIELKDVETPDKFEDLVDRIEDGIKKQRKENLTLKQYDDPAKISRFEQDIIRRILKSQGYYSFFVNGRIVRKEPDAEAQNGEGGREIDELIYEVTPGERYTVTDIKVNLPEEIEQAQVPELPIEVGDPLVADQVLQALGLIRSHIREKYCFYRVRVDYRAFVGHKDASAQLIFEMEPSEQVTFGPIDLRFRNTPAGSEDEEEDEVNDRGEGNRELDPAGSSSDNPIEVSVDEDYLRTFVTYEEGQCFKRGKVDATRVALLRSGLLANVVTNVGDIEGDRVRTTYTISERNHRTVKAGLGYSSDEGVYITSGWEHRNILGAGQRVDVSGRFSGVRQSVLGEFFIPHFFDEDTSLTLYSEAKNEDLDAYKALSVKLGGKVDVRVTDVFHFSVGSELKISRVEDEGEEESFHLLSFPLQAQWDRTNDVLNPTDGFVVTAETRPYIDVLDPEIHFLKSTLSVAAYETFDVTLQPTIAASYSVGSIIGETTDSIPADERFYVGGGGSVRGYPFQSLSQLVDEEPVGGSSFQKINTEVRIRFLQNWGLAAFVDGGFAFDSAAPKVDQDLLWGAGIGMRYYTAFAPFRVDVAFPLNKREGFDDDFQLYISIGQAF